MIGYVIAYAAPGGVILWALRGYSDDVENWFGIAEKAETTVGGFLFIVLAALALGIFVSGVRWLLIDHLMKAWNVKSPSLDFGKLLEPGVLAAYNRISEGHYRFYQFYANMLIASLTAYVIWLVDSKLCPWERPGTLLIIAGTSVSLLLSARDALRNHYSRLVQILGEEGGG